mmetsp:Transcript_16080/g.27148  ORF Transcript_16080/g.27148 Transcript_16080/m.27148 type:complete len:177 (-) Transcript_16080:49-579(-)
MRAQTLMESQFQQLPRNFWLTMSDEECQLTEFHARPQVIKPENYVHFFNYGLNPLTWNMVVNKQVNMTFEFLKIEKQMFEKRRKLKHLDNEIETMKKRIEDTRQKRLNQERREVRREVVEDECKREENLKIQHNMIYNKGGSYHHHHHGHSYHHHGSKGSGYSKKMPPPHNYHDHR